jgi:hypothetical protein
MAVNKGDDSLERCHVIFARVSGKCPASSVLVMKVANPSETPVKIYQTISHVKKHQSS